MNFNIDKNYLDKEIADSLWPGDIYKQHVEWAKNTNMRVFDLYRVAPDGHTLTYIKRIEELIS